MKDFFYTQFLFLLGLKKKEDEFRVYNGYINYTLFRWIFDNNINPFLALKIFKKIKIYSAREIRQIFRNIAETNSALFNDRNTYFTSFGSPDIIYKSGNRLIVDFRNSLREYENRIIPIWKIPTLPSNSNIIFFDDLIGTGKQSAAYIREISAFLNSSHKAYLFCICATSNGLNLINQTTSFSAKASNLLFTEEHCYTHGDCSYFNEKEKKIINEKIDLLKSRNSNYNLGLLIAFENSAPNNTLPLIWKDKFKYKEKGKDKTWLALLPREY